MKNRAKPEMMEEQDLQGEVQEVKEELEYESIDDDQGQVFYRTHCC